jgi:hypothetical protein
MITDDDPASDQDRSGGHHAVKRATATIALF